MSSQGANATTLRSGSGTNDYKYTKESNRDASDWIRQKREARTYKNYRNSSSDNKNTESIWIKSGNQFRLTYLFGRLKCQSDCDGHAIYGDADDDALLVT